MLREGRVCAMPGGHSVHDVAGLAAAARREDAGCFSGLQVSDVNNRLFLVRDGYWDSAGEDKCRTYARQRVRGLVWARKSPGSRVGRRREGLVGSNVEVEVAGVGGGQEEGGCIEARPDI